MGFSSIQDRMERDPYYLFNNARAQITPDCCQFFEVIATCLSPNFRRSRNEREKQLGTGVATRLVFMPGESRDIRKPFDVTKEAMVAHYARIFTLSQFAVLTTERLKARGELTPMLYGWGSALLVVDQEKIQDCFFDLADFAKQQWNDMYKTLDGQRFFFCGDSYCIGCG